MEQSFKSVLLTLALALSACCGNTTDEQRPDASMDASVLPRCSPLGGMSPTYCDTTDDGHCMTTTCKCVDGNGNIPTATVPMVGYDGGCDAGN